MLHFVNTLRRKSDGEKTRYAFAFACAVTLIIGAVWTTSLPARFTKLGSPDVAESVSGESTGFAELLEASKAQVGNVIEGVGDAAALQDTYYEDDADSVAPTSAFDTLTQPAYDVPDVPPETKDSVENTPDTPVVPTALVATSSPVTLLAKPEPQIIMIATTSRQKSE